MQISILLCSSGRGVGMGRFCCWLRGSRCWIDFRVLFVTVEVDEGQHLASVGGTCLDVVESRRFGGAEEGGLEVVDSQCEKGGQEEDQDSEV